jgi:hypothetical protein
MKKLTTNVFTCCNNIYNDFIPLFILSNIYHNDDVFVEVGSDKYKEVLTENSIKILDELYPNRFKIRSCDFGNYQVNGKKYSTSPNTVRFIETPEVKTNYVYITDIDIICLTKDFSKQHINHMEKFNQPYSNKLRVNKLSLTGLHFTPWGNYYPHPNFIELLEMEETLLAYDEKFLYGLVNMKYPNSFINHNFRPVHGIHASLNRDPYSKITHWGINKNNLMKWFSFRQSDEFLKLEPTLNDRMKNIINIIDNYETKDNSLQC